MLTNNHNWEYPIAQVLITPKQSGTPRPKAVVFLRPLILLVGRAENTRRESGIISPDFARLSAPGHPHVAVGQLPDKEQRTMSTKSRVPPSSRKKSKVLHLSTERIKESDMRRWQIELYEFLEPLSESEFELARKLVDIISKRPSKTKKPCEAIQFVKGVQS